MNEQEQKALKVIRKLKGFVRKDYYDDHDLTDVHIKNGRAYACDGVMAVRVAIDWPDRMSEGYPSKYLPLQRSKAFPFKTIDRRIDGPLRAFKVGTITKQKMTRALRRVGIMSTDWNDHRVDILIGQGKAAFRCDGKEEGNAMDGYLDPATQGGLRWAVVNLKKLRKILTCFAIKEPFDLYVYDGMLAFIGSRVQALLMQKNKGEGAFKERAPEVLVDHFNNLEALVGPEPEKPTKRPRSKSKSKAVKQPEPEPVKPESKPAPEPEPEPVKPFEKWSKVKYTSKRGRTDVYFVLWSGKTRKGELKAKLVKGKGFHAFWVPIEKLQLIKA